eukprot:Phypoly_transcript_15937.p1 GENE.Phypoly_transcript_15937~~Phypoly_transcript_15937.p1  ORF type:complete len:232 (+),score=24.84 Phypoly_transcript_15937:150-845(+)
MRLSQIAPSYSFLYRKSGTSTGGGEEIVRGGEVSNDRNGEDNNNDQAAPYYISYDGTFYDKHYRVANPPQAAELKNSELLRTCPQPADYKTYKDYESDLRFWKEHVKNLLASDHVRLPHVMGLYLFRPMTAQEAKAHKKEPTPESEAKEKSEPSEKDPWESQLVPEEPNPDNYNSYDEYKSALSRWATVCSRIPTLPPHASQISAEQLLERCTNVMQSSLPKGTKLYLKKP